MNSQVCTSIVVHTVAVVIIFISSKNVSKHTCDSHAWITGTNPINSNDRILPLNSETQLHVAYLENIFN